MPAPSAACLTRPGVALWMLCSLAAPAWAADSNALPSADRTTPSTAANAPGELLDFDIPAQPLAAALNRYGAIADQPAVFVSNMVAGRTSSVVQGKYSPEAGLRLLLQGTGLSFEKISSDLGTTFLLKEAGKPVTRATLAAFYGLTGYPGLIQARIREMLCADPLTAPGQYDTLFRFRLDGEGHIHNAVLLDTTGNARRDEALLSALRRVTIGLPPPPLVVEQPLTMRLRPSGPHARAQCARQQESLQ